MVETADRALLLVGAQDPLTKALLMQPLLGHDGDGKAYLTMGGGCHGCSMSRMTMLQGVQATIRERVPAIAKVIDATDHASGENPYFS